MEVMRPINLRKPVVNRKLIAWGFVITGVLSVVLWFFGQKSLNFFGIFKPTTVTFDLKQQKLPVVAATPDTSTDDQVLVGQLQSQIDKLDGSFSVYVYRSKTKTGYGIAADQIMPAASIMKVPIMVAVLKRIEEGKIKLGDHYILRDADKRDGSGPIAGMNAGTSLTVEYMLQKMGQNSDNSAPIIFINMVGSDYIQGTIKSLGMTFTSFSQNTTTAADLNRMWRSLYETQFLKSESLTLLEQYLTNSIYEDRIPAGLPAETKVIHKVGSGDNVWADTAVITSADGKKTIYLSILNDGVSLSQAKLAFPDLVKTIWNHESLK